MFPIKPTTLGKKIAELRKKRNLKQSELAEEIGKSTSLVAMWETGNRDPDSKMVATLANFFNVTSDYLLGLNDDHNEDIEKETPSSIRAWLRSNSNDLTQNEKEALAEDMEEYFKFRKARILKDRD
ncbi:helix-turn-helix domain-containing protein [Paenibacillus antarcticus]|uniref:HTH cro/C1-type domain-containing protein n=1 Tax=Paenibacillus antarcticus TaxID=253703 RepID=A0A168PAQ4_9BACL|nr:helix-turn-helix domain-containing protein [Paenibacillus antarcticus]OAB46573.1 hypothetical protein PBAT_11195 [Paenibacillus antarcticus]